MRRARRLRPRGRARTPPARSCRTAPGSPDGSVSCRSSLRLMHVNAPAVHRDAPIEEGMQCPWQESMLDLVDPGFERVPVVVVADLDGLLQHDRAVVDLI